MKSITIIGSGNWGSAIAKIVGNNTTKHSDIFEVKVRMWVYEEDINGEKLSEIINTTHENVKYLPGIKLPVNVVAVPSVVEAVENSDVLVWVLPHQFVKGICNQIQNVVKSGAKSLSCIKGIQDTGNLALISQLIEQQLGTECSVLMGANIANEVAKEEFSEATIGCNNLSCSEMYQMLFDSPYFRINTVADTQTVELCGALKNIVAVAAGFVDGMDLGGNTKAAIIRIGLKEMRQFCKMFCPTSQDATFFESCGVADLITTCYGGRNRKVSEAFVRTGKSFDVLEKEMLNGQLLQGPLTAKEVYNVLVNKNLAAEYPIFASVHQICFEGKEPQYLIKVLSEHKL